MTLIWSIGTATVVATGTAAAVEAAGASTGTIVGASLGAGVGAITNKYGQLWTMAGYKGFGMYPCCGGDLNSDGCLTYYDCCDGAVNSRGCAKLAKNKQKYYCCNKNSDSIGCKSSYSCCGKGRKSDGCIRKCNACNQSVTAAASSCGFEMKCCGIKGSINTKDDSKNGCKGQCQQCKTEWGKQLLPDNSYWNVGETPADPQGCSFDFRHDMKKISQWLIIVQSW